MENSEVARLLGDIADVLELTSGNPYKVRACRQAAIEDGSLRRLPRMGPVRMRSIRQALERYRGRSQRLPLHRAFRAIRSGATTPAGSPGPRACRSSSIQMPIFPVISPTCALASWWRGAAGSRRATCATRGPSPSCGKKGAAAPCPRR